MTTVTAGMDAGALKATHSPSPERAVTLKERAVTSQGHMVSCLLCSFGYVLVACESAGPFPTCT